MPPSVDRWIATLAQKIGATLVPATFQVTVCELRPGQLKAVFGWVTTNGPAAAFTVTAIDATPTPPVRLSRAIRRKDIVRLRVGIDSPRVAVLLRMSEICGNVRLGTVSGTNERKIGRTASTSLLGGEKAPRSYSSHM